jgi:hypothetical protein
MITASGAGGKWTSLRPATLKGLNNDSNFAASKHIPGKICKYFTADEVENEISLPRQRRRIYRKATRHI